MSKSLQDLDYFRENERKLSNSIRLFSAISAITIEDDRLMLIIYILLCLFGHNPITYVGTLYGYFDEYVDKAYFGLYTSLLFNMKYMQTSIFLAVATIAMLWPLLFLILK